MSEGQVRPSGLGLAVLRAEALAQLATAGVSTAQADVDLLIGHVLGLSRGEVQAKAVTDAAVTAEDADAIRAAIERRATREPLQHITGRAPFRSLELAVGPGVFVPRPETELVAQLAVDALQAVPMPTPRAADLGTGSGAIALALATEVPHAQIVAVENSPEAFIWARQNVRDSGVENVRLIFADLAQTPPDLDGTLDVVVSNPPYIPLGAVPRDPEVRLHDPEAALYGGVDGFDVVRVISRRAAELLRPGGLLVLEHGEHQAGQLRELLDGDGWTATATHRDLSGRDRATTAIRSSAQRSGAR